MRACRTCLSKYDLCPLFGNQEFSSDQLFLVTGVKISPDDGMPQTACKHCMKTITKSLHLRELSSKAEQFLKSIFTNLIKHDQIHKNTDLIEHIDLSLRENHQNSHCISQNEQTNESYDTNDYDITSDDDTKPIMDQTNDTSFKNNEQIHELEFVNIHTKKENIDYDRDKTKNCLTLSSDAQIVLYPTKTAECTSHITNESSDNKQAPAVVLCQSLKPDQLATITKETSTKQPKNLKYIIKCNANNIQSCTSEICQTILKNKLRTDSANVFQPLTVSDQIPTVSGQTITESDQTTISQTDTSDEYSKIRIEDFISSKDLNELFKDAHKFDKCDEKLQVSVSTGLDTEDLEIPDNQDQKDLFESLMSNLKKKLAKYVPKDTQVTSNVIKKRPDTEKPQKMDLNRRKYFHERNQKLLSIAVAPYTDKGPIQCSVCHEVRRDKRSFICHALKHFEKEYVCKVVGCGKQFVHRAQLGQHVQRWHGAEKSFSCGRCGFEAVDRLAINNHIRAEHTGEKPFECNECGARFRMRNNIKQHMLVHFKRPKNIQCEYCPSLFQCRRDLWIHQDKVHFYSYCYYCYLCSNTYKSISSARKHLLKLHGVARDQQLKVRRDKIRKPDAPNFLNVKPLVSSISR